MKRSEMTFNISCLIMEEWFTFRENKRGPTIEELSDMILTKLEKEGMLPPTTGAEKFTIKECAVGRTEYEYFNTNVWEPENETK